MSGPRVSVSVDYLNHLAALGATDLHPLGRSATALLIEALDLRPGQRVLEIGCGTAGTMVRIADDGSVVLDGVDLLPRMLGVAAKRLRLTGTSRAFLCRATATALPFRDQVYARACMESVLGFQKPAQVPLILKEVLRVLQRGGLFVANEALWKSAVTPQQAALLHAGQRVDFGLGQTSELGWNVDQWLDLMRSAGFRILSADRLAMPPISRRSGSGRSWRTEWSALLTHYYRLRATLSPSVRRDHREYRRRLDRHRDDGRYLEARLFVLQKPEGNA